MRLAVLVFAVYACVQGANAIVQPARLFDSGVTFAQFLDHVKAQRQLWLTNASRTDLPPDAVDRLKRVREGLRVLIVAEDWCTDSVHTVPYIASLATAVGVDVRIVDRANGEPIMSAHRTRDGRPVTPTVVLLRNNRDVGAWVERPAPMQQLFFAMATDPGSARQFAQRAAWYDADRGRTTIAEFVALAEQTAGK
jgi:Thioredoxin